MTADSPEKSLVKFLLVDDLEANLLALAGLLQRDGLELFTAQSGPEALELLLVHDFSLAFLDVQMAGMDGFELAQLMRGTERTRHVPIIFVTAGAVDFIFKPIEPHILKSKADVFFELARERSNLRESEVRLREANARLTNLVDELDAARHDAETRMQEAESAHRTADQLRLEAEAATRAKDEFLSMLSHELRTPLNPAMLLASSLVDDSALTTDQREDLDAIVRGINTQMRLVDDLLDVTRIKSGKLSVELRPLDVHEVLTQTAALLRAEFEAGHVGLSLRLSADRHHLAADPMRLQQIFWNILKNALKFSAPGGMVRVRTFDGGDTIVPFTVEIVDDGVGIEPAMLEKIFDPFIQESGSGARRSGGLGLGLAITRNLMLMHHGRVTALSEGRGKGTTFRLEFPVIEAPPVSRQVRTNDAGKTAR